ncbi:MAG: UvrD-helicase domain-containing protein [Myxococcales bacterium]|nr:UvrD-helicase domain-containing protein [Myxococcales bacterium]
MTGTARGITLVGANAGSGKTHRLTEEVGRAVDPTSGGTIAPEELVAVTYTKRAAGELSTRIRTRLVAAGAYDRAHTLPLAYLGTVHAVCLRLVQEFAIDAGLSPRVDVLAGDEARWLREALDWGLEPGLRAGIEHLASRLELRQDARTEQVDWLTPVQDIMTLARSNRIPPDRLAAMAQRSVDGLLALLPPCAPDGAALEGALREALERVSTQLAGVDDGTRKTSGVREVVTRALASARRGPLRWSDWLKLSRLDPAKRVRPLVAPLVDAAAAVERHPGFHDDLRAMTTSLYEAARQGLVAYDEWKRHRRVVDFVDMIDRALMLLEDDEVCAELRGRLHLLVVDELQDTSPVQLALFAKLHGVAGRSVWVGDRKQCVFEFAGADPALMEAVTTWVAAEGGEGEQLAYNWRSRADLVDACSHLFGAAFARHGLSPTEVAVTAKRPTGPDTLPPFGCWMLEASSVGGEAEATAEGVHRLLRSPDDTPIVDRQTQESRGVRAGDIAVLVATNLEAARLSAALGRRGIRATVARAGLMSTPEGTLVRAALGVVLDARDTLSVATLEALTGFGGQAPDEWLQARLTSRLDGAMSPIHARLVAARPSLEMLGPAEALDAVMQALDVAALCRRWPDPEQRGDNLDALRALTAAYEERCTHLHEAATLAGLARFLDHASHPTLVRDEERASDDQHVSVSADAVTVVTYHKAKGLEWPVVVLGSLGRRTRRDAFEVSPESDRDRFDPSDPLGGRWIRYWPWPFGAQGSAPLADRVAASAQGLAVAQREDRERVRLLYVGFTRARDHLILAIRKGAGRPRVEWLETLRDAQGPLVGLPAGDDGEGRATLLLRGASGVLPVAVRWWELAGTAPVETRDEARRAWFAAPTPENSSAPTPFRIAPSGATVDELGSRASAVAESVRIGPRLPLERAETVAWNVVGDALHAFLASDVEGLGFEQRRERARRILTASDAGSVLTVESMLAAGDRLRSWTERRWPGAIAHREFPIAGLIVTAAGARRVQGTIDLLLETAEGVVVIDHKSHPGPSEQWPERAREYVPQVDAYASVLAMGGRRVLSKWIHFAIGGGSVRVA